jgi:YVTN family beta-propeller protein
VGRPVLAFRILGPFEVVDGDRPLVLGGPKLQALLAVLLLNRGEVVSTDRLIDALWGERASGTAAKTVQVYVSNLRKALGDGQLVTRGHGYLLQTEPGQVDSDRFQALVAEGRRALQAGDARVAAARLREGLALWRGPALADFAYEGFAQGAIARLEEERLEALEDRIDADLAIGEQAGLVGELDALVAEHPLRERLQGQLMLTLYRSGRQADALESYRKARQALIAELGLEPGRALQDLERAILTQDPALDRPSRASGRQPATVGRRGGRGGWLIAAAGAVLLAALVLVAVKLSGSGAGSVRVPANSVAAIDPHSNNIVGFVPVGSRPGPIVYGSGSLWVANLDEQTVTRIDPASLQTLHNVTLPDPPTGLAAGARAIWVAQSNPAASSVSVNAIDPQYDVLGPTTRVGNAVPGDPAAVATQGGSVWIAPSYGALSRLNAATRKVVRQIDPNAGPAAIAVGGDGAIWLTDTEANNVIRVDPTGVPTPTPVGNGPTGIAVGESDVWVADSLDDTVKRIDPATHSVTTTIQVGRSPAGVAVGDGSVWVANSGDGTVTRIDPRTNKPLATITVGGSPQAITIADGRAWVTVDAQTIKPSELAPSGGTLRIESQFDTGPMDPALASGSLSWQLLYATCTKLVNFPDKPAPAGSRLIPEVAASLPTRSADGRTYTFTIRPGFRFSPPSNQPVTAQTFKDTIERNLNPKWHRPGAEFGGVVGEAAYTTGKAPHISGIVARGDTLSIRLLAAGPDFPAGLTQPIFCALPSKTPVEPKGLRAIPSAGPYYVESYTPGQGVVLKRNPNYRGSRPHQLAQIELVVGIPTHRAVSDVEAGTADYASLFGLSPVNVRALASHLDARYGPGSRAARAGAQQFFVNPVLEVDYFYLNTHRPLFANVHMRQALNYAIDRRALANLGFPLYPLPEHPTDHYLPPGMPGYSDAHAYPLTPDVAKARALAQGAGRTAVLYTCDVYPCAQQAEVLRTALAAIGLKLQVVAFGGSSIFVHEQQPGARFDIGFYGWVADHPDPADVLPLILENPTLYPAFDNPSYQRRLTDAAQLTGPARYLAYGKLDLDLARNAAPLLAFGNPSSADFFSARIGCQTYGIYGMDLAALCIKRGAR